MEALICERAVGVLMKCRLSVNTAAPVFKKIIMNVWLFCIRTQTLKCYVQKWQLTDMI